MIRIVQIGTIHSCRKATKRTANQASGPLEATCGLCLACGSIRFFRQLLHYLEEFRLLPNK
jgi:hypothetical protein